MQEEYDYVEQPILQNLKQLGWQTFDPNQGEFLDFKRQTPNTPLLESIFLESLQTINPWISERKAKNVLKQLKIPEESTMQTNRTIWETLIKGTTVQKTVQNVRKNKTVHIIDWENPENNTYHAVSQFKVKGPKETIKPDITCFINGIPITVIECKAPSITNPKHAGIDQMKRYQNTRNGNNEGAPRLFWYNQLSIVAWRDSAVLGTLGTPEQQYKEWKTPYPTNNKTIQKTFKKQRITHQDRLIHTLLHKQRLLDFIKHFTVYEQKSNNLIKMVARYQQYRATQKTLNQIQQRKTNGGVIWHTQGSGKSLTMLFLALKLRQTRPNPNLLLVTDRKALDQQIHQTFTRCGYPNPKRAKTIEDLKNRLKQDAGETITTLVHKFNFDETVLNTNKEIYVMVDEAHRTQYKDLANQMRTALPNAYYIGFTGTPIEKQRRNTEQTFGRYIDTYTIDQSITDNTTLPLHYQGRIADIHIEGKDIDTLFDRIFKDKTSQEKQEIKKRYAQQKDLAEAPKRIQKVCLDIVNHFEETVPKPFKGMIVTTSRHAAVRYKETLDELNAPTSAVVISGDHNDPQRIKQHTPTKEQLDAIKTRFEDPNEDLRLLIVCNMLLTGYDAPLAQVMYLDKPLKEHSLLQAIARVNRPYEDKNHGLIIDYYGISDDYEKALATFSSNDVKNALTPLDNILPELQAAHRACKTFFTNLKDLDQCIDQLKPEDKRIQFNNRYKEFSTYMDILLPSPKANPYKADLYLLGKIYQRAKNVYRDESMDLTGVGKKVRKLIHDHISSSGIDIINQEPVSIMDTEAFQKRLEDKSTKAKLQEMEQGIKQEIRIKYDEDPAYYKSLQEKLEELIQKYKERREADHEKLSELQGLVQQTRQREQQAKQEGFETKQEYAFYNNIKNRVDNPRKLSQKIDTVFIQNTTTDWQEKPLIIKRIRSKIRLKLLKHNIEYENVDKVANTILQIGQQYY